MNGFRKFLSSTCGTVLSVAVLGVLCSAMAFLYHAHDVGMLHFGAKYQVGWTAPAQQSICPARGVEVPLVPERDELRAVYHTADMHSETASKPQPPKNIVSNMVTNLLPNEQQFENLAQNFGGAMPPTVLSSLAEFGEVTEFEVEDGLVQGAHPSRAHHKERALPGFHMHAQHDTKQHHEQHLNASTAFESGVALVDATYFVLTHGLFGRPAEQCNLGRAIQEANIGHVLYSTANTPRQLTWDGVDNGGRRLAQFIKDNVPPKSDLILVGHSLGGVYIRQATWQLTQDGWFKNNPCRLRGLLTVSSPQLAAHHPNQQALSKAYQFAGQMLSKTAVDLHYHSGGVLDHLNSHEAISTLTGRHEKFHVAQGKPFVLAYAGNSDREVVPEGALMLGSIDQETLEAAKQTPYIPYPHPMKCGKTSNLENWRRHWISNLGVVDMERYIVWWGQNLILQS